MAMHTALVASEADIDLDRIDPRRKKFQTAIFLHL
jgi:hypothetical protein